MAGEEARVQTDYLGGPAVVVLLPAGTDTARGVVVPKPGVDVVGVAEGESWELLGWVVKEVVVE